MALDGWMAIQDKFTCQKNALHFNLLLIIETNSTVKFNLCMKKWDQKHSTFNPSLPRLRASEDDVNLESMLLLQLLGLNVD